MKKLRPTLIRLTGIIAASGEIASAIMAISAACGKSNACARATATIGTITNIARRERPRSAGRRIRSCTSSVVALRPKPKAVARMLS